MRASPSPQRTARQPRLSDSAESRGSCRAAGTLASVRAACAGGARRSQACYRISKAHAGRRGTDSDVSEGLSGRVGQSRANRSAPIRACVRSGARSAQVRTNGRLSSKLPHRHRRRGVSRSLRTVPAPRRNAPERTFPSRPGPPEPRDPHHTWSQQLGRQTAESQHRERRRLRTFSSPSQTGACRRPACQQAPDHPDPSPPSPRCESSCPILARPCASLLRQGGWARLRRRAVYLLALNVMPSATVSPPGR